MPRESPARAVIVGASLAGARTAQGLRRGGWAGPITMIGAEPHPPYDRPPLSKGFLLGRVDQAGIALLSAERFAGLGVDLRLGRAAVGLDPAARHVALADGTRVGYDALVVATGSVPRALPDPAMDGPSTGVHVLRTLDDALALRASLTAGARVVVVGGGFIGAEIASACRALDLDVAIVEADKALMGRGLGGRLGTAAAVRHAAHGVRVLLGRRVVRLHGRARPTAVELDDGTELPADVVVVGVGSRPATDWLEGCGLTLDDGVVCDETLAAVGVEDVYAVGDVARWRARRYGTTLRTEHWTAAGEQAAAVAATLCGTPTEYDPVPYVWSDQFGARLQIFGRVRPADEVVVLDGDPEGDRFVAVAGGDGRMQGVVALNAAKEAVRLRRSLSEGASWPSVVDDLRG
ncbi:NAD(P)/FAD-dependent oxidoreductase [Actinomadura sp. GTD37]|uniref:NAD(P)/FAD-dependent oxidoreductase n=1 Tax=Actinomadura sp. GTD37 TaxID=1778030 RepID=UPI0035C06073